MSTPVVDGVTTAELDRTDRGPDAVSLGPRVGHPVDRLAWALLAAAMMASGALLLWLNRGTTFFFDELTWFGDSGGDVGPESILEPHSGHLLVTTRLIYLLTLETVGPEYVVFRLLGVVAVMLAALAFFALAKERVGSLVALAPAIVLLFLGSAWQHVAVPIGFTVLFSIAAGLAALLALGRGSRRADLTACGMLCVAVATFGVGLAFLAGSVISVLLRGDRLKRSWIFGIPLVLYLLWRLWARRFGEGRVELSNLVEVPAFVVESVPVATGALTGVNYPFIDTTGLNVFFPSASLLGWAVAVLFVGALAWRVRQGGIPSSFWASLGVLLAYWTSAAVATPLFLGSPTPDAVRFLYPGAIGVLLVATDAARGLRLSPRAIPALFAVAAFSVSMNVSFLRDGGAFFRTFAADIQGDLSMLELAANRVPGSGGGATPDARDRDVPDRLSELTGLPLGSTADYLGAVERYGSPAFSLDALRQQSPGIRNNSDVTLASAYRLRLAPAPDNASKGCAVHEATGIKPLRLEIPAGGATLRIEGEEPAEVSLRRFGETFEAAVGELQPRVATALRIPTDVAPDPWHASIPGGGRIEVCAAR